MTTKVQLIRGTHPDHFRSGDWAELKTTVPGDGRECYLVEFPDGVTDFWAVDGWPYEFAVDFRTEVGE